MVFVPTFNLNEEKKKELRKFSREWNKDHNVKGGGCWKLKKVMLMLLIKLISSSELNLILQTSFLSDADGRQHWW